MSPNFLLPSSYTLIYILSHPPSAVHGQALNLVILFPLHFPLVFRYWQLPLRL